MCGRPSSFRPWKNGFRAAFRLEVLADCRKLPPEFHCFFLLSIVRRKRNDSVPVSMICARSVIRSKSALHNRVFGNTVVHSENGRLVVTMIAVRSARSEIPGTGKCLQITQKSEEPRS